MQPEAEVACAGRNTLELPNGDLLFGVSSFCYANTVPDYGMLHPHFLNLPDGRVMTAYTTRKLTGLEDPNRELFSE